ncbi:MAG: hypothetical protein JST51_07910 [Armatimonadetes bacterium]|nr:hypothetical protein [Armatimonadota bacterium]
MNALSLFTALVALHGPAHQNNLSIDVYRVNPSGRVLVKNGESLTGEVQFRAIVQTEHPIQAVEFYVGDDLRESDGSTPYEFKLDTLAEEDGPIKIRFKAFTTEGQNTEKVLTLKVDNGVSLGAEAHIKKGNEFFSNGQYDEAIREGRIAQKADKDSLGARLLLAHANFAKGVLDKAQKFAEDALDLDKNNREAKEVIISIKVKQAFNAVSRSADDRKDVLESIKNGLSEAVTLRTTLLNEIVDNSKADKTSLEYLDAAIRARRYSLVIEALEPVLRGDFKNNDLNDRLAFAYLMTNQISKADDLLRSVKKFGEFDAYGFALSAIVETARGNDSGADDRIKEALLNTPDSLGLKTAQAFIALKRDNPRALSDAASSLIRENDSRPETYYFAAALSNHLKNIEKGRQYFEKALAADAADHDMYIEQGNEAISLSLMTGVSSRDQDFQLEYARVMYDLALQCRGNSAQALSGVAISALFQKKGDEALRYAEAATKAAPDYAAAWYTYAAALSYKRMDARVALKKAQDLDPRNLEGRSMPDSNLVFKYFNTTGRTPVLSPPAKG